jgi:hypothetical protein
MAAAVAIAERLARGIATRRLCASPLAVAIAIGAILECTVFRHAYMLADRSTVTIVYKGARLERGHSERVIVLGPSTALAIDADGLQRSMLGRISVYNYALPNLGTAEQYYFILKRYLQFNRKPDVLVLALPPDSIVNESLEQSLPFIEEIERQRFRRFFGPMFLLTEVVPTTRRWSFVTEAAATILPSVNYRVFIKNGTFAPEQDQTSDWEPAGSVGSLYGRNRAIIERLEATNGELVYSGDRVVAAADVARSMPGAPNAESKMAPLIEKVIRLADSSGISTRLFFTPLCCEREQRLASDGTWALLSTLLRTYEARYSTFRFVDAGLRSYEREYFGDPVHVNERGAARFNTELAARFPDVLAPAPRHRPSPAPSAP